MFGDVELIIFDCDGVLIDSEMLVCRLTSEELTRLGYPISVDEVIARFAGRAEPSMIAEVERDWGRAVPGEYLTRMRSRIAAAYAGELQAIPEVRDTLARLRCDLCVASSSYPEKLRLGLHATGLLERFGANVISAARVAHGKPAPDVFVYAAGWMRARVANCLVVEDSVPGVRAARAAGMRAVGFTGGRHCRDGHADRLLAAGADCVIGHMSELERIVPHVFASDGDGLCAPVASPLAADACV